MMRWKRALAVAVLSVGTLSAQTDPPTRADATYRELAIRKR
jgi:hypothetical protein